MARLDHGTLFEKRTVRAKIVEPTGVLADRMIQIRTSPISGRTSRITFSRINETEAGADCLPSPPPDVHQTVNCPFCLPQVMVRTPQLIPEIHPAGRMKRGESLLFPNLFPYGAYSAVSLFDNTHFVEIGTASEKSYVDCLVNCADYLTRVKRHDPAAVYMAITQNHLPSAGGSLVHPHLQIHADEIAANHHRFLFDRTQSYWHKEKRLFFDNYLESEIHAKERMIGSTGPWVWLAAFAPEGFFEIWAIYRGKTSMLALNENEWRDLAGGMICVQRFYRGLHRNGYNFGLLSVETPESVLELRAIMTVRSNYAPWVRSDHTGFEVMLGDMATFTAPEETAQMARTFWT